MVTVSVVESTTEFFERERSFMMKSWCSTILMASCEYPSVSAASWLICIRQGLELRQVSRSSEIPLLVRKVGML